MGYSSSLCGVFSLAWLLLLQSMGSLVTPLRQSALRHVESSQTRDRTHVPCISRQILDHWTTREVPRHAFTTVFLGYLISIKKNREFELIAQDSA